MVYRVSQDGAIETDTVEEAVKLSKLLGADTVAYESRVMDALNKEATYGEKYERLFLDLHKEIKRNGSDSYAAEKLRDQMDDLWKLMSTEEQSTFKVFADNLRLEEAVTDFRKTINGQNRVRRTKKVVLDFIYDLFGANPFGLKQLADALKVGDVRALSVTLNRLKDDGSIRMLPKTVAYHYGDTIWVMTKKCRSERLRQLELNFEKEKESKPEPSSDTVRARRRPEAAIKHGVNIGERWVKKCGFPRTILIFDLEPDCIIPDVTAFEGSRGSRRPISYKTLLRLYQKMSSP
jgi:hypothetical protein